MKGSVAAGLFIGALALERGVELVLARRNEKWIRREGGIEAGRLFTNALITFHLLWFISFLVELRFSGRLEVPPAGPALAFVVLQAWRYWCIASLGRFWNTRILVLPGAAPVRSGPYKLLDHPNYLAVCIELPLYPALFGCWVTALVFGTVNILVLRVRISQENSALDHARAANHY